MSRNQQHRKTERAAHLAWVPIASMSINPLAQRDLNRARAKRIADGFDIEQIGTPTVNQRDGKFYIIDGHHRIEAMRMIGWGDQQVQCWVYHDLSEAEEAERFLKLNDVLNVSAFAKFQVGVHAGRPTECDVDRIVRANGCIITTQKMDGAVSCVSALMKIYTRSGGPVLGRTIRIVRDAYGDPGMTSAVLDGVGLLCARYNGALDDDATVTKLSRAHGGVTGLLGQAEITRRSTGRPLPQAVASAAVDIINRGRGGKKLPPWFGEIQHSDNPS